ncbi:MAG TPA: DUF3710 domain-containing protein [Actinophytocola sp.]|nr:DUF3710 domain-containing protein [Actinophytocola sp.]
MGLFGRRKRDLEDEAPDYDGEYDGDDVYEGGEVGGDLFDDAGPYDVEDAPEDGVKRLDLGAVRFPVPPGAALRAKFNTDGTASEAYVLTDMCVITVSVFAAPRSGELWREEWCGDLASDMRKQGNQVRSVAGAWGQELLITMPNETLRFVGVDGPRWMLRAVVSSPPERVENAAAALYALVRGAVVVRGSVPMPVGTPLPLELPEAVQEHIRAQARARAQAAQAAQAGQG